MNLKLSPENLPGAGQAGQPPTPRGKDFEQAKPGQNPPSTTGVTPTPTPAPSGGPSTGTRPPGYDGIHSLLLNGLIAHAGIGAVDDSMLDLIDQLALRILARYPGYLSGSVVPPATQFPGASRNAVGASTRA